MGKFKSTLIIQNNYKTFFFCFLGLHPQHMEIPRLGVKFKLQLPEYATSTETQDLSHVSNLHHSSQPCLRPTLLLTAHS